MIIANIHEAKTNLSKLIEAALAGKDVLIARAGEPVVKLISYKPEVEKRVPGALKGKSFVPDDFDDKDPEINKMFYGE